MERRLDRLIARHRALDERIRRESHPRVGWSSQLQSLKRLRLALKDRIAAIQRIGSRQGA